MAKLGPKVFFSINTVFHPTDVLQQIRQGVLIWIFCHNERCIPIYREILFNNRSIIEIPFTGIAGLGSV